MSEFSFFTKIKGVSFCNPRLVFRLEKGDELILEREKNNKYDSNAISILDKNGNVLGHISREIASEMGPAMDSGIKYKCFVEEVTGGYNGKHIGCNIKIVKVGKDDKR